MTVLHLTKVHSLRLSANRYEAAEAIQHAIFGDAAIAHGEPGGYAAEDAAEDAGGAADDSMVTAVARDSSRSETSAAHTSAATRSANFAPARMTSSRRIAAAAAYMYT